MVENMKLITHLMLAYVPIKILNLVSVTEFFSFGKYIICRFSGWREGNQKIDMREMLIKCC